jgi:LEA14-like dessication related protein
MSKNFFSLIRIKIFLLIMMALILSSCGIRKLATGEIAPPKVEFQGVTVYPPESQYWPLTARLRLHNPNPEPLRILGYDYEVAIEGTELVRGESLDAITLPAAGENLVEIPVLLKLTAVPNALKALLLQERLRYEISGGFRLASVLGGFRVPYHFRGEITRQEGLEHLREFFPQRQMRRPGDRPISPL